MSNDTKQAQQIFNQALSLYESKVKSAQANPVDEIRPLVIDLSIARTRENALKVSFPFKSVQVEFANDLATYINLLPESDVAGRGSLRMGLLDIFETEYGMSCCYLWWEAQPKKSIKMNFFTTSKIQNGRLVLDSNSVTDNIAFGNSQLQNDSLSIITLPYNASYDVAIQQSGIDLLEPMRDCKGRYDKYFTGSMFTADFKFQVPMGYQFEIYAVEVETKVANANSGLNRIEFLELPVSGSVIDCDYTPAFARVACFINGFGLFKTLGKAYPTVFFLNDFFVPFTTVGIIDEGKGLGMKCVAGTTVASNGDVRVLGRLKRKVV